MNTPTPIATSGATGVLTVVLPLEIAIRLGNVGMNVSPPSAPSRQPINNRCNRAYVETVAERVRQHLIGDKSVLSVKTGYLFKEGQISDDVGVVISVAPGESIDPVAYGLGPSLDGVIMSVETADPVTIAEQFGFPTEAFAGRTARYERDRLDPRFDLSPVIDDMTILLHVSPEAGWPALKHFLKETDGDRLTIGMYHMTAPHIVDVIEKIADDPDTKITLTLDRQRGDATNPDDTSGDTKKDDFPERDMLDKLESVAGERFKWAPASLGAGGLFASAYHIKVAVWSKSERSGTLKDLSFWLSSGNWQSSNQAPIKHTLEDIDKVTQAEVEAYNREWRAIVRHGGLAKTLRNHLEQDYLDNAAAAAAEAPLPTMPDVLVPISMVEEALRAKSFEAFQPETIKERSPYSCC